MIPQRADAKIQAHASLQMGPAVFVCAVAALLISARAQRPSYDLVLRNGHIVDGSGNPWFKGDLAISGDAIVKIAPAIEQPAARVIDVGGAVVAPGFIDIHTHARRGLLDVPTAPNYVRQGVTTVMEGPDGSSPLPISTFLAQLERLGKSLNIGTFVGQGSVREAVIGRANRPATPQEIQKMAGLVEQAHEGRRVRPQHWSLLCPGHFHPDRRGRRARARGRTLRRHARVPSARRRGEGARQRARDDRDRRARRSADANQPRESHRARRTGASSGEMLRLVDDGARTRRGCDARSVSLHGVEHEHRGGAPAGLAPRGWPGGHAGASARSGVAGTRQSRDAWR